MKYGDGGDYPGTVPEFGSIFMSNAATRKECLELKLLGLPSGQANFVKCVKAGMILFLFEFESRELHGVYRADSDGAMNIVPHAYESSGKQFPAQVRFSVIWDCMPLSEHEFRDAIRENYYSKKKFNFGLSEDQVRRLLCLFSSRQIVNGVPQREIGRRASLNREEERVYRNKKSREREREEKLIERYSHTKPLSIKFGHTSPGDGEMPNASSFPENFLGYDRIKGVVDDSMNSIEAKIKYGYDMHHNSRDSFYSSMRQSKDNQFLRFDTVHSEHTGNTITPDKIDEFLARARRESDDDGRFQLRGLRGNKHALIHDGFPVGKSVESFGIPQIEHRRPLDDQRLLTNVDHGHYLFGGPQPANSGRQVLNRASEVYLHDSEDLYRQSQSSLRDGYRGKMEQPLIGRENYENPMTSFRSPIHERRHIRPSVEFDEHLVASQGRFNHEIQGNVFGPASSDYQDLMMNYGMGCAHSRSFCENSYGIGSYKDANYSEKKPSEFKTRRCSVFARLSVSKSGLEHEGHVKDDEMDVSVDQVMESLRESLSRNITHVTDRSSLVNRNDTEESFETKRRNSKYNQTEVGELAMMTQKVEIECKPDMEAGEKRDDVLRETRGVDFKRRSETKRKRDGEKAAGFAESAKGSCGNLEAEKKGEGMRIKRRKLVRPSFGEKKELNNNDKRDELPDSQLLTHESSNNNNKAVSGQSSRNPNCPSLNCDAIGKLVRPVLGEKEELRDDSEGDGVSHLPLPTHESSNNNKAVSGQSQRNPNCPYPNSEADGKLVIPVLDGKDELRDDSEGDGVSELPLPTHESSNDSKAATCDYSGKTPGHPSSP